MSELIITKHTLLYYIVFKYLVHFILISLSAICNFSVSWNSTHKMTTIWPFVLTYISIGV